MASKDAGNGLFTLVDYARSLIETMMEAHDRFYVKESDFDRTIAIDSLGVGTTDFELPRERAVAHCESGRAAAEEFFTSWSRGDGAREPLLRASL